MLHKALEVPVGVALEGAEDHVHDLLLGQPLLLLLGEDPSLPGLDQLELVDVLDEAKLVAALHRVHHLDGAPWPAGLLVALLHDLAVVLPQDRLHVALLVDSALDHHGAPGNVLAEEVHLLIALGKVQGVVPGQATARPAFREVDHHLGGRFLGSLVDADGPDVEAVLLQVGKPLSQIVGNLPIRFRYI